MSFVSERFWIGCGLIALTLAPGCGGPDGAEEEEAEEVPGEVGMVESPIGSYAGAAVLTQHNDNARSGRNTAETLLTPGLVGGVNFGKVAARTVRGSMYAQPLYVPNVSIPAVGSRNVVFVATMHNAVYAFDADNATTNPYWVRSFGSSISLPDGETGFSDYRDIWGEVGVISTPVIDLAASAMFVVTTSKSGSTYKHELHKLSLATGANLVAPVQISSAALSFDSKRQNQRAALLLQGGKVYIAFGAYQDRGPYAGYLFAYNANNLTKAAEYRTTPMGEGGIWMAGQGPSGDGANVYFVSGNGDHNYNSSNPLDPAQLQTAQSVVKMTSTLSVASWFAPHNSWILSFFDADVGAAGTAIIPGTNLVVAGGKESMLYVLNKDNMGYQNTGGSEDTQIVQKFRVEEPREGCTALNEHEYLSHDCNHIHGSPVFHKDGANVLRMYVYAENDYLRAFRFNTTLQRFECGAANYGDLCPPDVISTTKHPATNHPGGSWGMPGGMLSVSSNGTGGGIVWANHPHAGYCYSAEQDDCADANPNTVDGMLYAYDATTLAKLWDSEQNPTRDDLGAFAKYAYPTISGGQVFTPTMAGISNKVRVISGGSTASSDRGPAIAQLGGGANPPLVVAWKDKSSDQIKVASTTNGTSFSAVTTLAGTTDYEPAMTTDGTRVFLAWTGKNNRINVISSVNANMGTPTVLTQTTGSTVYSPLNETTNAAPALAYGGGKLFVAWKEPTFGLLRVMSSSDGLTFNTSTKVNMGEGSDAGQALFYANNKLYLVWKGPDGRLNVMTSTNGGASFGSKTTYSNTSPDGPAIVGLPTSTASGPVTDLYLLYTNAEGVSSPNLLVMTAENAVTSAFSYPHRMKDIPSDERPAAALWKGKAYVAWTDTNDIPMLGRWSPGELVVYGKLQ